MARSRSPKYPSLPLPEAIERVELIFGAERQNPIDRETAARLIGFSGISGAADQALGTLMQFGLMERVGRGEVRVANLAVDILHPEDPVEKHAAIHGAATSSPIFAELLERYPPGSNISNTALKSFLVREEFSDRAIQAIIKSFIATCNFILSTAPDENSDPNRQAPPEPAPNASAENPSEPQATAVPQDDPPNQAPQTTTKAEVEWLRLRVSSSSEVRILVTGELTPRGIGHLITLLSTQKAILEDDLG